MGKKKAKSRQQQPPHHNNNKGNNSTCSSPASNSSPISSTSSSPSQQHHTLSPSLAMPTDNSHPRHPHLLNASSPEDEKRSFSLPTHDIDDETSTATARFITPTKTYPANVETIQQTLTTQNDKKNADEQRQQDKEKQQQQRHAIEFQHQQLQEAPTPVMNLKEEMILSDSTSATASTAKFHHPAATAAKTSDSQILDQGVVTTATTPELSTFRRILVSILVIALAVNNGAVDLGLSLLSSLTHRLYDWSFRQFCGDDNVYWRQFQQQHGSNKTQATSLSPSWFSFQYIAFRIGLAICHVDRLTYEIITLFRVRAESGVNAIYLRVLSMIQSYQDAHDLLLKHQLERNKQDMFHWRSIVTCAYAFTPRATMDLPISKKIQGCI